MYETIYASLFSSRFRRDLDDATFARVCENPRQHTGAGYQRKR
jgi:hypothetical protein